MGLRESQQFSPNRSQTLMPSFVFLCSRQCSTGPPSQPSRPATRRGIFFREFRFPYIAVPSVPLFRYSHVLGFLYGYRVESSRAAAAETEEEVAIVVPLFSFFRHFWYVLFLVLHSPFSNVGLLLSFLGSSEGAPPPLQSCSWLFVRTSSRVESS